MIHELKIKKRYADEIANGNKMFEIRKNDRDYQKGDLIQFVVIDMGGLHELDKTMFQVTYVLSDFPEGLVRGYVILGIKKAGHITKGFQD